MPKLATTVRRAGSTVIQAAPNRAQSALLRTARWLDRQLAPTPVPTQLPAPPSFVTGRALPLPTGVTEVQLREVFDSWSIDGEPAGHMIPYVADSFERFIHTFGMIAKENGTCLELGANPYFTTFLLEEFTELRPELANFFGGTADSVVQEVSLTWFDGTRSDRTYSSRLFNVEDDQFPYDDGSIDVVMFCEIIEHLLMNPVAVLRQIHRVLVPDGLLVLTTPNVCRLENAVRLVNGENIYDPYSGYGPYGRHNREYTKSELEYLLRFTGFDVEDSFTADGHVTNNETLPGYDVIAPLLVDRPLDLGGYHFIRARKARPPEEGLPSRFFRSWPNDEIVED